MRIGLGRDFLADPFSTPSLSMENKTMKAAYVVTLEGKDVIDAIKEKAKAGLPKDFPAGSSSEVKVQPSLEEDPNPAGATVTFHISTR